MSMIRPAMFVVGVDVDAAVTEVDEVALEDAVDVDVVEVSELFFDSIVFVVYVENGRIKLMEHLNVSETFALAALASLVVDLVQRTRYVVVVDHGVSGAFISVYTSHCCS